MPPSPSTLTSSSSSSTKPASSAVAAKDDSRRYLIRTNHGDVVVNVDLSVGGLSDALFSLEAPTAEALAGLDVATPLTAFGAKVVDIIELAGTEGFGGSAVLREMLVKEKATSELKRIERFAKSLAG